MEGILNRLTQHIRTREELISLLEEIIKIKSLIFQNEYIPLSEKINGKINNNLKKLIEQFEREGIIPIIQEQQLIFFEKIENKLESLPEIKLEISFWPNEDFLEKISQWLNKELKQKTIIDLAINPKIVGGAVVEYQGKWRDFSLAKKIEEMINLKIKEINQK